jgi:hypothetical protein
MDQQMTRMQGDLDAAQAAVVKSQKASEKREGKLKRELDATKAKSRRAQEESRRALAESQSAIEHLQKEVDELSAAAESFE